MANRETPKIHINRDRFFQVLKARGCSIRKLGEAYNEIQRTEKTIRRCLDNGEMPPDLLERIARYLNVHPDYLAGVYDKKADRIEDAFLRRMYLKSVRPEKYPYLLKAIEDIDYSRYFEDILTMNHISMEQFKTLDPVERVLLRQELVLAILEVIAKHFEVDSLGNRLADELEYCKSFVDNFDPHSYFAELEGIVVEKEYEESTHEESPELSEIERKWEEKYTQGNPKE
jgi:hypothetical protein